MTLGFEAIRRGHEDEDLVRAQLIRRGWSVVPFGQRDWDPATNDHGLGSAQVINAVRGSEAWPLRHAPDLLVAKEGFGPARLVEVFRSHGQDGHRCMELAKLVGLDWWAEITPVYLVEMDQATAWRHGRGWVESMVSPPTRAGRGSGDPFAWFRRDGEAPFPQVFP